MKQLENNVSSLKDEPTLPENSSAELTGNYAGQKTVGEENVKQLMKSVSGRLVGMVLCISGDIPKLSMRSISQLEIFKEQLPPSWIRGLLQNSGSYTVLMRGTKWLYCICPYSGALILSSVRLVGNYRADRACTGAVSKSGLPGSFEERAAKEEDLSTFYNNGLFKAYFMQ